MRRFLITMVGAVCAAVLSVGPFAVAGAQVPVTEPPTSVEPCTSPDCQPQPAPPKGERGLVWSEAAFLCAPRSVALTVGNGSESSRTVAHWYIASSGLGNISQPLVNLDGTPVVTKPGQSATVRIPAVEATGTIVILVWAFDAQGRQLPWQNGTGTGHQEVDCTCPDAPPPPLTPPVKPPPVAPPVSPPTPSAGPPPSLPATGSSTLAIALAGVTLLGLGAVALGLGRQRRLAPA